MSKALRKIGFISSLILILVLAWIYFQIETFLHGDTGCSCSSTCRVFYPTLWSRLLGNVLMLVSAIFITLSLWTFKGLSRWWTMPALFIFVIAFYGNGFMIMNDGACGLSINKVTWMFNKQKIGDYAKSDAETIHPDSLRLGKYKGKLLGYAFNEEGLKLFKIGEDPVVVKTRFLFWEIEENVILNDISYGLNVYRDIKAETIKGHYEFIGGKGMSEKDFLNEFVLTQKEMYAGKMINKQLLNLEDGTTKFIFDLKTN